MPAITTVTDSTHCKIDSLKSHGDGRFQGDWLHIERDDGGAGAPPQGEARRILSYTSVDGTFEHEAFSTGLAVNDEALPLHREFIDDINGVSDVVEREFLLKQAFNTTVTTKNSSVTLFTLDALAGPIKDIQVEFYLAADGGVTKITPSVYKTRAGDIITFTKEVVPAIIDLAQPGLATASRYRYTCKDLREGDQFYFSLAQTDDGAATIVADAALTYKEAR